jgi:hypothetical protein
VEAPRERAAQVPVSLSPRLALLAGREELLTQLDAQLSVGDGAGPRIVTLYGLGGAGKTSVAVEYAHRHLTEVGLAWQFHAEDTAVLADEFGQLVAQLGVRELLDARDPVDSVHGVLAAYPAEWLLVFDNATDRKAVGRFLPPAGRGRVLVTSRSALWRPGQAVEVPVLDAEVAADYLVRLTDDADRGAALELAGELGGLPLALEQAGAYVQASGGSLARYLASFRKRRPELLARGGATEYGKTVATTWALAFTELEQSEPAVGLLRLLAFCAPEPVPLDLLLQPRPGLADEVAAILRPLLGDELAAGDAVAALRRYSLVTLAGEGLVLVHRLVQAVTADQMPAGLAGQWRQAAAALVEAAVPADPELPETWPVCARLIPHARAVLDLTSGGMRRIADYLGQSGSFLAARDLWRLIARAYGEDDAYGPEHPDTLVARANLGHWTGAAGDAAGARNQFAALLPVEKRVLGPEHPRTLADGGGGLARWTGEAGDAAGARGQLAVLLPVLERVLGGEHPDTLTTRHNLALWTGEAGDAAGARDQLAALVSIQERVMGREHPDTLIVRNDLARWTGEAGDAAGARDQLAALVRISERVLGTEHPGTLDTGRDLAYWTAQAGDWAAARDQFAALLPIHERVLGPEHPRTLADRSGVAVWTGQAGDAAGARDQLTALLPIEERVLGAEHPDTLTDRANLAFWTGAAGDAAGARDQYTALLLVMERVSPDYPYTLAARARLAWWTGEAGDAAGARDQYAAVLPVMQRVLGAEHPETLIALGNLAVWTGQAGNAAGTRDELMALLPIRERVSSAEDPDTLIERARLARWTGEAGDAAGARDQLAVLLPILERVLGPEHPDTLVARRQLAYWTERTERGTGQA